MMAPREEPPAKSADSRVTTRSTNANRHPGTEAVDALRVKKTRRDPKVIQAEKEKKQAAKEEKERQQQVENTRKETSQKNLDEFRVRQLEEAQTEKTEASRSRKRNVSSIANDSDGTVAKKTKMDSEVNRPRPRPRQLVKKANVVVSTSRNTLDKLEGNRKRSSPASAGDEDGNASVLTSTVSTPVRPVKKVKGNAKAAQPLRRTETFIVATELTGPAGVMVATAEKVDSEMAQMGDNATPRQQNVQALDRDSDNDVEIVEPYETPVVLKRQKKKPIPAPVNDESEAEVSELEQNQQRKRKKENKGKGREQEASQPVATQKITRTGAGSVNSLKDVPIRVPKASSRPINKTSFRVQEPDASQSAAPAAKKGARVSHPTGSVNKGAHAPTSTGPGRASFQKQEVAAETPKGALITRPTGSIKDTTSKSSSESQASSASRTTALHQIVAKTAVFTKSRKGKTKSQKSRHSEESEPDYNASDEDDSLERKAALLSPVKGIAARKANKTQVKVERLKKKSLSKDDEVTYSNIVLPVWLAAFATGADSWKTPDGKERNLLIKLCERVFGEEFAGKEDFTDGSELWKKAKDALSQYRSRMKLQAFQAVQEDFEARYSNDLKSVEKRMKYGKEMLSESGWRFLCSEFDNDGAPLDLYQHPLIIKTFSVHFYLTTPKQKIKNYKCDDPPIAGVALAVQAVEHALKMYRDDRLEYKKGSLLVKKTETATGMDTEEDQKSMQKQKRSTKFDFSGTNYLAQTFGYCSGIKAEHKIDPDLFTKICDKAKKASGARKPADDSEDVEDKYASIRLDPAFIARASLRAMISGRAVHKTEDGENGEVHKMDRDGDADEALGNGGRDESEEVGGNESEVAGHHGGLGDEPEEVASDDNKPEEVEDGVSDSELTDVTTEPEDEEEKPEDYACTEEGSQA